MKALCAIGKVVRRKDPFLAEPTTGFEQTTIPMDILVGPYEPHGCGEHIPAINTSTTPSMSAADARFGMWARRWWLVGWE